MDQAGEIVTDDLRQCLVDHRNIRSGSQRVTGLSFHHRKTTLYVRAQMVAPEKVFSVGREVAVHVRPRLKLSEDQRGNRL